MATCAAAKHCSLVCTRKIDEPRFPEKQHYLHHQSTLSWLDLFSSPFSTGVLSRKSKKDGNSAGLVASLSAPMFSPVTDEPIARDE
mmetsp:Transcript_5621/g.7831  ORF Transcript_5621/g.7831 Transcript_5621/m.7831 type:complete len:86 (-) Transcript_5621:3024-3281(-)